MIIPRPLLTVSQKIAGVQSRSEYDPMPKQLKLAKQNVGYLNTGETAAEYLGSMAVANFASRIYGWCAV